MARNSKRKNDDLSKLVTLIAVIIAILVGLHEAGYITIPFLSTDSQMVEFEADGNAYVHFIDVGQGDCQLIISDDGSTMLIDGGEVEYGAVVVSYLNSIRRLDRQNSRIIGISALTNLVNKLSKAVNQQGGYPCCYGTKKQDP